MSFLPQAVSRGDVADYVDALFLVYFILIFARIVLSWVLTARGSLPYSRPLRTVTDFIMQTTDPYLNLFRRLIPPLGGARMAIDITPILAILVLFLAQGIVVDLIPGVTRAGRLRAVGAIALAVLAADQLAKAAVRTWIERGDEVSLLFGVDLVHVRNDGIAFGLFGGATALVLLITVAAVLGLGAYIALQPGHRGGSIAAGLLAGGAVGNLLDRLAGGEVTDFVDLPAWPAFNLADIAITVGISILIVIELLPRRESKTAGRR